MDKIIIINIIVTDLEKINEEKLTISLEKCESGCSDVKYLGFLINEKGLKIDEDKIKPILEFLTPKNLKKLQRIIGMISWYRRFMSKFSEIIESLQILLRKGVEWEWGTQQEQASDNGPHCTKMVAQFKQPNRTTGKMGTRIAGI